ncbi:hypothetical protein FT663_04073 [Candidozyma haemuli var. vulneris]|uniref:Cytochrome b-c1 complex subunit 2, mitochondrial n=1 Tax=Candidozyma haemuli TaxID=45357 RepID=A0A2V1AUV5_9ASCO|nr:hypothetical protein CXQ85_004591 [[Candida] haemuloni]KAF3988317.1 hypothetical protein FT663_04073 [[Candida] haemuloni var. vulneris]KAF3988399.1 hypothetical protein FT662_03432 [[Candida] haemuloni var. vulneris]PVH21927.1 hypothetical protein CXQ85_004591 [[Candida] haemuloni]
MLSRASARAYSTAPVKLVSRDAPGNLTTLSVKVNNAGSKAGKIGVAHLLSKYAFLNNEVKSALRFTRESELLGGSFSSYVTRDAIVLNTQFLKQDLPYYVDALANTLHKPLFRPHELVETVIPVAEAEAGVAHGSTEFVALEHLHELTFRKGLGNPLYYDAASTVSLDDVKNFASEAYTQGNVSLYASGANESDLANFVAESAFSVLPPGTIKSAPVKTFTGKEARFRKGGESSALIGVPVAKKDFAKYEVLSAAAGTSVLKGAASPLSKIPGADSRLYKYEDAGLFVVAVTGQDATKVAEGIKAAKKAVEGLNASALSTATKAAELSVALQDSFEYPHNIQITADSAKGAKLGAFNYVAVGNTDVLPYADEL